MNDLNWTAGILAFVLLFIPMVVIFYRFHKRNQEIDRKYEEAIEQIKKRYRIEE